MTSYRPFLFTSFFVLMLLSSFAQERTPKINSRYLIGEWYSKDSLNDQKRKPVATFYKDPAKGFKDSLVSYFKIDKNQSLKMVRKSLLKPQPDTLMTVWIFDKETQNLKIIEKIRPDGALAVPTDTAAAKLPLINKINTFHIDFMSKNKMVIRYSDTQNKPQ